MAKSHRTSTAPSGSFEPLRNPRLYGDRDAQIEGAALRARGCPNPNGAVVNRYRGKRGASKLASQREQSAYPARLQAAQTAMLTAQRAVRAAKERGEDFAYLASVARDKRAKYLELTGGVEGHAVDVASYKLKVI